jgi:hypothetical protein
MATHARGVEPVEAVDEVCWREDRAAERGARDDLMARAALGAGLDEDCARADRMMAMSALCSMAMVAARDWDRG